MAPVRLQVDKLMERAGMRIKTLHEGHPLKAQLPPETRPGGETGYAAPMPLTGRKAKDGQTPISHMNESSKAREPQTRPSNEAFPPGAPGPAAAPRNPQPPIGCSWEQDTATCSASRPAVSAQFSLFSLSPARLSSSNPHHLSSETPPRRTQQRRSWTRQLAATSNH